MTNAELRAAQKANVLSCLCHGHDLGADRSWISAHTGYSDRMVRNLIEDLRNEGHLICNLQDGRGYYIAETEDEIWAQYRQDCARAMSILRRIKPFRHALMRAAVKKSGQMDIEDLIDNLFGEDES